MSENPANHVFVDLDVERQGDLLGDSRTAPIGIVESKRVTRVNRQRPVYDGQDKRRFFSDARASPPPIFGLMTNSNRITFDSST